MAVRSKKVDSLNLNETLPSETSGTHAWRRNGAIAMADDQPNRSAKDAATVRRSSVFSRSPIRTRRSFNGPRPASRRSSPAIQPGPSGRPTSTFQLAFSERSATNASSTGDSDGIVMVAPARS